MGGPGDHMKLTSLEGMGGAEDHMKPTPFEGVAGAGNYGWQVILAPFEGLKEVENSR